jgi:hypothetical protein
VAVSAGSVPGASTEGAAATDAAKVLADMLQAIGRADTLAAVRTLTMDATLRRSGAKGASEGPFELALELPDKFVTRTALTNLGPMSTYLMSGFNGDGPNRRTARPT